MISICSVTSLQWYPLPMGLMRMILRVPRWSGDEATTSAALAIAAAPAHVAALPSGAPQIHPKASNSDRLQSIGEQHATIAAN